MKTVAKMFCVLPVLLVAACAAQGEPQFVQADANNIRQRTQEYEAAFNTKEPGKVVAFYTPESVLMPPNAPTLRGKEPIQSFYVDLYAQGATDLELETKDVRGHGPLAYESGSYSLLRRPATGTGTRDRGKYLFIWRNTNGTWLLEYTIWSSDLPDRVPVS